MADILWRFAGEEALDFLPGAELLVEGERLDKLLVLISGSVEVVRSGTTVAMIDTPGAMLGEMSVLLDIPHTATVRAITKTRAYRIGEVSRELSGRPLLALELAKLVAQRLDASTMLLAELRGRADKTQLSFIEKIFAALTSSQPGPQGIHHE